MAIAESSQPDFPIHTDRLVLRPHRLEDLDDLVRFHGDPEVVRFVPWPVRDRAATEQALRAKLGQAELREPGQWLVLAVELRDTATVIGEVLLRWTSALDRQGEVGFAFSREHHGRGYAAEATTAMLRVGFDEFGLHRISALCIEQNEASARLLRRLGFCRQGRLVDSVFFKGAWATQLLFAITEDEWRGRAGPLSTGARSDVAKILDLVRCFCGALTEFSEQGTDGHIDVFGDIAHWFGHYTKDGLLHGEPCPGSGMKSMQFVRTDDGWRVVAAAWDDCRPGGGPEEHCCLDLSVHPPRASP